MFATEIRDQFTLPNREVHLKILSDLHSLRKLLFILCA